MAPIGRTGNDAGQRFTGAVVQTRTRRTTGHVVQQTLVTMLGRPMLVAKAFAALRTNAVNAIRRIAGRNGDAYRRIQS